MTEIYFVRHCEAYGNVKRLFQGTSDFGISELGEKQLPFLTERFKNIHIDKVYASPLYRTRKTAKAIIGNRNIPITEEKGIMELDGGIYEGKPFAETFQSVEGLADIWDNHPEDFSPPKGESMRHAYERMFETTVKIAKENAGKTVVCASHGGAMRCLICRLIYGDITRLKDTKWSENTAVALIRFDDSFNPELVFYNDDSHLPEEYKNRKSRIASFMKG